MSKPVKKFILVLLAVPIVLFLLSFALAVGFEDKVADAVLTRVYRMVETEVCHEKVSLNLWRKFPSATLEVHGLDVKGRGPESGLAKIERVYFQFSLLDLVRGKYRLKKADVQNVRLTLCSYADGSVNWDIIRTEEDTAVTAFSLQLSAVQLSFVDVGYRDSAAGIGVDFRLKRLAAKGDFSQDRMDVKFGLQGFLRSLEADSSFHWGDVEMKAKGNVNVDLKGGKLTLHQGEIALDREVFQMDGSLHRHQDSIWKYLIQAEGKDVSVGRLLEMMPMDLTHFLEQYRVGGSLNLQVSAAGSTARQEPLRMKAGFAVRKGEVWQKKQRVGVRNAVCSGSLEAGAPDFSTSLNLHVRELSGDLPSGKITASLRAENLNAPHVRLQVKSLLRLQDLKAFFPSLSASRMEGKAEADLHFENSFPSLSEIRVEHFGRARLGGRLKLADGAFQMDSNALVFEDFSASLAFSDQVVNVVRFSGRIQGNSCELSGRISSLFDYLGADGPLKVNARLTTPYLDVDAFVPTSGEKDSQSDNASGRVDFPTRVEAELQIGAKRLKFDRFEASRIQGMLYLHPNELVVKDFSMDALGGQAQLQGSVVPIADGFRLSAKAHTRKVDIQRLFYVLHDFGLEPGGNSLTHQNIRGGAETEIHFSALLDSTLELVPESIDCDADVLVTNGKLVNYKALESLSRFVNMEDLREIRFETLKNRVGVHKAVVTIPEMEVKNSALNLFLSGSQTFEGDLHYNIKMHLGELLARKRRARVSDEDFGEVADDGTKGVSLYLLVAGTTDNPVFKWNREKARADFKDNLQQQKQELKSLFGGDKKDNGAGTPVSPAKEEKKKLNDSKQKPAELEVDDDW